MNCCDDYGNCDQGRNCPVRVAKVGNKMPAADPLPSSTWRYKVRKLAYWMLVAIIALIIYPVLCYFALRLS
jgi:hypothetical protein